MTVLLLYTAIVLASLTQAAPAVQRSKCAAMMDGKLPSFVPSDFTFSGNVRKYYLAAEETEWDYIPTGYDNVRGVPIAESNIGKMYAPSNTSLGHKYIKGLFRGYTDDTYKTRATMPPWQGFQGPVMRAEVGDMIEVLLENHFTDDDVSMHSMGLFYDKVAEGSDYWNASLPNGKAAFSIAEAIPPAGCYVYKWLVPQTSAPLSSQASKLWTYHGDINLQEDVDTGLVGPAIIYQSGKMAQTVAQNREFVLFYASTTESDSVFFGKSVQKYLPAQYKPDPGPEVHPSSPKNESVWDPIDHDEPNRAIKKSLAQAPTHLNGYLYSNLPGLEMCLNDKVLWYIYTFGIFSDGFHVAHPHGNNFVDVIGENQAYAMLQPAVMLTLSMTVYNPGNWDIICHNGDHYEQGMQANYFVHGPGHCPKSLSM